MRATCLRVAGHTTRVAIAVCVGIAIDHRVECPLGPPHGETLDLSPQQCLILAPERSIRSATPVESIEHGQGVVIEVVRAQQPDELEEVGGATIDWRAR